MKYELNHYYNFRVTRIYEDRISLEDEDGRTFHVRGYDFQTQWDASSPQVPIVLKCYVKDIDSNGRIRLEQCDLDNYKELYPSAFRREPKAYPFIIESRKRTLSGEYFFVVRDAYGLTHTYKPSDDEKLWNLGDEVNLTVIGYIEKGDNRFALRFKAEDSQNVASPSANDRKTSDNPDGRTFGVENDQTEFKTTIVYPARSSNQDIDTQMQIIAKTLAGFMNAKGGILYIGVDDNGDAVGIEDEFSLLNSSETDAHEYTANTDGYERKIRASIKYYLGQIAENYVNFVFPVFDDGHTICKIEVEPSDDVIWYKKRDAYKRLGTSTSLLISDCIEKLVLDKYNRQHNSEQPITRTVAEVTPIDDAEVDQLANDEDVYSSWGIGDIEKKPVRKLKNVGNVRKGNGSFYMNLFASGEWSWTKETPADSDLEFSVPINSKASKKKLMLVYEDGRVNKVNAYQLKKSKKEQKKKGEGARFKSWKRTDGVKLLNAFAAEENDMIACFTFQDDKKYLKLHTVKDVSEHNTFYAQGNLLIPTAQTEFKICFVSAEHKQRISALNDEGDRSEKVIKTKNQKSSSAGVLIDPENDRLRNVYETLENVCDVLPEDKNVK